MVGVADGRSTSKGVADGRITSGKTPRVGPRNFNCFIPFAFTLIIFLVLYNGKICQFFHKTGVKYCVKLSF